MITLRLIALIAAVSQVACLQEPTPDWGRKYTGIEAVLASRYPEDTGAFFVCNNSSFPKLRAPRQNPRYIQVQKTDSFRPSAGGGPIDAGATVRLDLYVAWSNTRYPVSLSKIEKLKDRNPGNVFTDCPEDPGQPGKE